MVYHIRNADVESCFTYLLGIIENKRSLRISYVFDDDRRDVTICI